MSPAWQRRPGPSSAPDPKDNGDSVAPTRAARRAQLEAAAAETPRAIGLLRSPLGLLLAGALTLALVAVVVLALNSPGAPPLSVSAQRSSGTTTSATSADSVQLIIDSAPSDTALSALGSLPVVEGGATGYTRERFGAPWTDTDGNGCDQRNDTLRRDLSQVTLAPDGCGVATGTLPDPLSGTTVTYAASSPDASVAVLQVVSLADAWATGASTWSDATRTRFANDPANLMAVSIASNRLRGNSGGLGDAAAWLPESAGARCTYVARQVAVKVAYALGVSSAERRAMAEVLQSCPEVTLAAVTPSPFRSPTASATETTSVSPTTPATTAPPPVIADPTTSPTLPTPTDSSPTQDGVRPGSACSPVGAEAMGTNGKLMRCTLGPNDVRPRWRTA